MANGDDLEQSKIIGKIEAEVHTLNTLVKTLFEKFDAYVEKSQPKPMGVAGYIGIGLSILSSLALVFGSVIYIANSANAPINTQLSQLVAISQSQQVSIQGNTSFIQLTNKEVSGIKSMAQSNESTLEWLIFQENLPKQLTTLQEQVKELQDKAHLHPNMTKGL